MNNKYKVLSPDDADKMKEAMAMGRRGTPLTPEEMKQLAFMVRHFQVKYNDRFGDFFEDCIQIQEEYFPDQPSPVKYRPE